MENPNVVDQKTENGYKDAFVNLIVHNCRAIERYREFEARLEIPTLREECEQVAEELEAMGAKWREDFVRTFPEEDLDALLVAHLGLEG